MTKIINDIFKYNYLFFWGGASDQKRTKPGSSMEVALSIFFKITKVTQTSDYI